MATDIRVRFGHRLRELRRERGLSQSELAERAQVTPEFVSRLERSRVGPSLPAISRLARALGVAPRELFEFEHAHPVRDAAATRLAFLIDAASRQERRLLLRLAESVVVPRRRR